MSRPVAFAAGFAVTSALGLAACQSVLGIQDVDIVDASAAGDAASGDATALDGAPLDSTAPADASSDGGVVDSAPPDVVEASTTACQIQCANSNTSGIQDLLADGGGMCLCGPNGACTSACTGTVCAQPPSMPNPACVDCLAPAFLSPMGACHDVLTSCGQPCAPLGTCAMACAAP